MPNHGIPSSLLRRNQEARRHEPDQKVCPQCGELLVRAGTTLRCGRCAFWICDGCDGEAADLGDE